MTTWAINRKSILPIIGALLATLLLGGAPARADDDDGGVADLVDYFVVNDGATFERSLTPQDKPAPPLGPGRVYQTVDDGDVTVAYEDTIEYADSGFYLRAGELGDIDSILVESTGPGSNCAAPDYDDCLKLNLWFDKDNNNEFFLWAGNTFTGCGLDSYGLGPFSSGGTMSVEGNTEFFMQCTNAGSFTLDELKAGLAVGITANTEVAVWIGVCCGPGDAEATVTLVEINGDGEGDGDDDGDDDDDDDDGDDDDDDGDDEDDDDD